MKRNRLTKFWRMVLAFCLSIAMFCMPLLAQQIETEIMTEAHAAAERDAEMDTNSALWFAAGCLGGVTGLLVSYIYAPSPPASRLLGKSPEYIAYYTDFYKAKVKQIQTKQAKTGCITAAATYVGLCIVYIALIIETIEAGY